MYKKLALCLVTTSLFCLQPMSMITTNANEISKAECVMEMNSRRILYESHGDTRLPMASTTKIITAITALSICDNLEEKVIIPPQAEGVEGSSVYLKCGEEYSVRDLLYGLMLRSGNDCAVALAVHCSGGIDAFSAKMNQTAERAGALHSHFKNPHGLPCNGHYTTARDLTSISCFAMQNSTFREIVATKYYEPCHWKNKNKMLYNFDGAVGVKTGYTKEAGRCLVSAATKEGMTIVCSVLNCRPMYERSTLLLNDAFQAYKYRQIFANEEVFSLGEDRKPLKGYVKEEYFYPLLDGEENSLEYVTTRLQKTQKLGNNEEIIGQLEIYLAKHLLFSTNLYKL